MQSVTLISDHGDPLAALGGIQAGGQNVYVREVALALDGRGWQVDVFTHQTDPAQPQVERLGLRSRVIRLDAGRPGFVPKQELFPLLPRFRDQIRAWAQQHKQRYTAIHSNYWLSGWVGMELKQLWGVPLLHTFHSLGKVRAAAAGEENSPAVAVRLQVERQILATADRIIATNPVEKKLLRQLYAAPNAKVTVVPCGVDPEVFYPRDREQARRELGLAGLRPIMFAGRFEPNKGLLILLQAVARLFKEHPGLRDSVRLLVAGGESPDQGPEPREQRRLRKLAAILGLRRNVCFLGPLQQPELACYFAAAEVTVVPSYYETFGLVALEAMACGCPVIASDVGGLSYTVQEGETGLLVPPGKVRPLARALGRVLQDQRLLGHLQERLSGGLDPAFTWPRIASRLEGLYRSDLTKEVDGDAQSSLPAVVAGN